MLPTNYQNLINDYRSQFDIYYQELVSYNDKVNLTAIVERNDVFTKHFLDSILAIDAIPQNASIVDVGTGAGFPGLPIKIVRPDVEVTLVDSLNKRINFLNMLCQKLNWSTCSATNAHAPPTRELPLLTPARQKPTQQGIPSTNIKINK